MKYRAAAGLLASAAILGIAVPAANASTTTAATAGFLISPVKALGPQPIEIKNLGAVSHTYRLTEVQTQWLPPHGRLTRGVCGPTNRPSDVLSVPGIVTIPAGQTVSVPVRVAHAPETITDVAVRVTQAAAGRQRGVGITVASYAQEIVGRGTASDCSVIRGDYAQKAIPASSSSIPVTGIVIGVLALLAVRGVFGRGKGHRQANRRKATHAAR